MRYLECSYADLLLLPEDYVDVVNEIASREKAERAARNRQK